MTEYLIIGFLVLILGGSLWLNFSLTKENKSLKLNFPHSKRKRERYLDRLSSALEAREHGMI